MINKCFTWYVSTKGIRFFQIKFQDKGVPDYNDVLSNSWGPEGSYSLVLEGLELNAFPCIAKIIGIPGGPGPPPPLAYHREFIVTLDNPVSSYW